MNVLVLQRGRDWRWWYVSLFGWLPFRWASHGGWVCLNWRWLWRFAVIVPKNRGWRWD